MAGGRDDLEIWRFSRSLTPLPARNEQVVVDARFTVSDIFTRWSSPSLIRHALLHPRRKHLPPLFLLLSFPSLLAWAFDRLYPPGSRGSCREQASLRSHKSWPMYFTRIGPPLGIRAVINYHRHAMLIKNKGSVRFALPMKE